MSDYDARTGSLWVGLVNRYQDTDRRAGVNQRLCGDWACADKCTHVAVRQLWVILSCRQLGWSGNVVEHLQRSPCRPRGDRTSEWAWVGT